MITPAYALTATERVLPRMALDFTTASLDPRVTVTRALNTATRVGSNGLISAVNADLPRFDYDPVTLACKGLLIEETRVQTARATEAISSWSKASTTGVAAADTAPNGVLAASRIYPTTTGSTRQIYLSSTATPTSGTVAISVFAKPAGKSWLVIYSLNSSTPVAWFNVTTGVVGTVVGGWTASIHPSANGYYRCVAVGTAVAGQFVTFALSDADNSVAVTANSTDGLFLWGAQVEAGAFATSYIPNTSTTNGSSVTRNADVVTMTGTNFSSWWQATTGSLLVRARQASITGTRPWAHISDGTADNIISLRGNTANPELYIKATTDQAQIDAGTLAANTSYGLVGSWNTNDCAAAINGGTAVTDASATIPTVDRMSIGGDGTNYISGWVEKMFFWPQRITNAEAQAFSK